MNVATAVWIGRYTAPSKVTSHSSIPTSDIVAESVSMDGFTLSQKDHVGITTTASRTYTATGMTLVQVDGRGNATTIVTDLAGRTVSVTDAANHTTTTVYDTVHDLPAVVTDAMGYTSCYKYELRGRKVAEWGTALQPACFGYDEMNNMTTLRTFRAGTESISTDPSERTDYDETSWTFHPATGLELSKTYADNSTVTKSYDAYNRLATETNARGRSKVHTYEHARGLLLNTTYYYPAVDDEEPVVDSFTPSRSFAYNHLGQLVQIIDAAGTRALSYNTYGELETDSLLADDVTHLITENRDSFGRSTGYTYAKNGEVQQTVTTGYGDDGRICSAGFVHGGEAKNFGYTYLAGTNLLQALTKPNGMTLTQTYESTRDLLTCIAYHRGSSLVVQRDYLYDALGRPTTRNTSRQGSVMNDTFTHNTRSELSAATVNGEDYAYLYDNIGNRTSAVEGEDSTVYTANALNQYTVIRENTDDVFTPEFDADGNQTRVKTSTGIWALSYDTENRPTEFTTSSADGTTTIQCAYDTMGRRVFKKVTTNGTVTLHQRYIYRGYLQIACCDLTRTNHPCLWLITWDPTQSVATRPLAIQKDGTWYTYGIDLTKNVCEVFGPTGYISTAYTYTPFGEVTATGNVEQPILWSSEMWDGETALVYYNWRYYSSSYGRWNSQDIVLNFFNNYYYAKNPIDSFDYLGLSDSMMRMFEKEIINNIKELKLSRCKFIITYSRRGNIPGEKFDTLAVLRNVSSIIRKHLSANSYYVLPSHTYEELKKNMDSLNSICGLIFIGHAGSTNGPSRLMFDNGTSLATEDSIFESKRYIYTSLTNKQFICNNISLLIGCRTASDKRFVKIKNDEYEISGTYESIAMKLSGYFSGTVIASYNKLNFNKGVPETPFLKGGNDFRIYKLGNP